MRLPPEGYYEKNDRGATLCLPARIRSRTKRCWHVEPSLATTSTANTCGAATDTVEPYQVNHIIMIVLLHPPVYTAIIVMNLGRANNTFSL